MNPRAPRAWYVPNKRCPRVTVRVTARVTATAVERDRDRCPVNMAHMRQMEPDSGLEFQVNVLKAFEGVPSSLGSSGDTTPCRIFGVTLHSHVRYKEI